MEVSMNLFQQSRKWLTAIALVALLTFTTACGAATAKEPQATRPTQTLQPGSYGQLARGNSAVGQDFGNWVVTTSKGLIKDAYVRDNNKLGVVISSQVRPTEVKELAKSITQGFHKNFPNQDLSVLVYAPDKQLILTAQYDQQSNQIQYQSAS
jgi:ABC-type phosphate/phosphonate transport system substrate-binding protein